MSPTSYQLLHPAIMVYLLQICQHQLLSPPEADEIPTGFGSGLHPAVCLAIQYTITIFVCQARNIA